MEPGIHQLATSAEAERAIEDAVKSGWQVFRLGENVSSIDSFFETVRQTLPLDPPVQSCNWDALEDSLWSGLEALQASNVLIVWPSVNRLSAADSEGFKIANSVFKDVCESLMDSNLTVGNPKAVVIIQTKS